MAIRIKTGSSRTDPFGNNGIDFWGVINVNNGSKKEKKQVYCLEIYKDQQTWEDVKAGTSNVRPVFSQNIVVEGSEYDSRFSPAAIAADRDHFHQAYIHLLSIPVLGEDGQPEVDEEGNPTGALVWGGDWETDE